MKRFRTIPMAGLFGIALTLVGLRGLRPKRAVLYENDRHSQRCPQT